ncbi:c-type cytochrome [Uliginosibacterium sp. H1]|uniref:c-type cytochrome n=1 Tax=Uliginosibacterium sp. H1 TaxID=3114757 RepID=UPI002E18F747|nr:cytochrome c [Uliginosibacterium sp. H1]
MKKIAVLFAVVATGLLGATVQAAEGRAQIGAKKVSMCIGCHGIPGYKIGFPDTYHVPKLGGQHPDYIVAALKAYKNGERQQPTMNSIAASLSEQDMADIAAYYAGKKKK